MLTRIDENAQVFNLLKVPTYQNQPTQNDKNLASVVFLLTGFPFGLTQCHVDVGIKEYN